MNDNLNENMCSNIINHYAPSIIQYNTRMGGNDFGRIGVLETEDRGGFKRVA